MLQASTHPSLAQILTLLLYKVRKNEKALAKQSLLQRTGPAIRALIPKTLPQGRNPNLPWEGDLQASGLASACSCSCPELGAWARGVDQRQRELASQRAWRRGGQD